MTVYSSAMTRPGKTTNKRKDAPSFDPLKERAQWMANTVWERAKAIAQVLAPQNPVDQEEMPPYMQWLLLEKVAINLSPAAWDDPEAIKDLYDLRKQFAPALAHDWMPVMARYRKTEQAHIPDPTVTPASPDFEKMKQRLKR
jgi:hypothetical protein